MILYVMMNWPSTGSWVSYAIFIIAPRGWGLNLYPQQKGLVISGGLTYPAGTEKKVTKASTAASKRNKKRCSADLVRLLATKH